MSLPVSDHVLSRGLMSLSIWFHVFCVVNRGCCHCSGQYASYWNAFLLVDVRH